MSELKRVSHLMGALLQLQPENKLAIGFTLTELRKLCALGAEIQNLIASNTDLLNFLDSLLSANVSDSHKSVWLLLANTIVQNKSTQLIIWQAFGTRILEEIATPLTFQRDVQVMILYNVYLSGLITAPVIFEAIVRLWQTIIAEKCQAKFEFLHITFEHFLVSNYRQGVAAYAQLPAEHRLTFLDYLLAYIRNDSPNGLINGFWLQRISKDFKLKSDCILRTGSKGASEEDLAPREVYALLRVIASASGSEQYAGQFESDNALFLNVSSVLRALVALGQQSKPNIFTPMTKLEEVTPNSPLPRNFESELSYELKTLLMRCVANLLYRNKTNQGYCLDTQLMSTLFESTNLDARNPLLKEWSILAIRNACDGCPEIQEVVANLTKVADAPNDMLKELNLEMGSLRIKPDQA